VKILIVSAAMAATGYAAQADEASFEEGAYLDPPYANLVHPTAERPFSLRDIFARRALPRKTDTLATVANMTDVKSQGARGTCSIFSATAMLEGMLVINGQLSRDTDLSEEWLEYVIQHDGYGSGSTSTANFRAFVENGSTDETAMPYVGETWTDASYGMAKERCANVPNVDRCLIAHRDPRLMKATDDQLSNPRSKLYDAEFLKARRSAIDFREQFLTNVNGSTRVSSVEEAKELLSQGIPVTLDQSFYYGAWNHRKAEGLGIGRDLKNWKAGIIGYPEPGSLDAEKSPDEPAGHSILIVGYDDDRVVTTRVRMADGTEQTFRYKGVYYFKNSWGTDNFGTETVIDGRINPGYGVMTQKYAHDYGSFYQLPIAR
jgi:hypothetical protein